MKLLRTSFKEFVEEKMNSKSYQKTMTGVDQSLSRGTISKDDAF